jgi:hypothetical protein
MKYANVQNPSTGGGAGETSPSLSESRGKSGRRDVTHSSSALTLIKVVGNLGTYGNK